jgi:hypothetical protein
MYQGNLSIQVMPHTVIVRASVTDCFAHCLSRGGNAIRA